MKSAWGVPVEGIRVGLALKNRGPIAIGAAADLELLVRNTTDKEIAIQFPKYYYKVVPLSVTGLKGAGSSLTTGAFTFSNADAISLKLAAGETKSVEHPGIAVRPFAERTAKRQYAQPTVFAEPGDYEAKQTLEFRYVDQPRTSHLAMSGFLSFAITQAQGAIDQQGATPREAADVAEKPSTWREKQQIQMLPPCGR